MSTGLVQVARLLRSFALNQIIASAARADLFGRAMSCSTVGSLAEATGLPERSVKLLVAVLDELDLVEGDGESIRPTLATPLLARDGGPLYGQALLCADEYYRVWAELDLTLRTGESAFERVYGEDMWSYLDRHPEALSKFSRTMSAGAASAADAILSSFPFGNYANVVDVGAGDGTFLWRLLAEYPSLSGVALELPSQAREARRVLATLDLPGRARVAAADMFFDPLPPADLFIVKGVLHNWPDRAAAKLIGRMRAASPGASVLVVERLVSADGRLSMHSAINNLTMSLLYGASERTSCEYRDLLADAGYDAAEHAVLDGGIGLIVGVPT